MNTSLAELLRRLQPPELRICSHQKIVMELSIGMSFLEGSCFYKLHCWSSCFMTLDGKESKLRLREFGRSA